MRQKGFRDALCASPKPGGNASIGYVLKVFPRLSQTFILNELRAHEAAGVDLVIFALKAPRAEDVGIVEPALRSRIITLTGSREGWSRQLAEQATRRGVRHLHAHFGNVAAAVAMEAAAMLGIEYSFTAHAVDIFDERVDVRELRLKLQKASSVVTVSDYNARHFLDVHGREVTRIYNGLPLDQFPYHRDGRAPNRLLAVGRLVEKKGFATLIDGCSKIASERVDFHCMIVGEGPLRSDLARRIREHGLEDRVELLGARPTSEVRERLRYATVLVAPCRVAESGDRDGIPTVLLEAMALGTPCISTDVAGIPEVVIDGKTGLVVPPGDSERLALACRSLFEDPVLAKRLARTARGRIERDFDSRLTSARLRKEWRRSRPRIVFRVYNRRVIGHWMRAMNIANALLDLSEDLEVVLFCRAPTEPPIGCERIKQVAAIDPERMDVAELCAAGLEPDVLIDDTIIPPGSVPQGVKRVFVMRKRRASKLNALIRDEQLRDIDLVIVPHVPGEFDGALPDWLIRKSLFVGPIVRAAKSSLVSSLQTRYGLAGDERLIVSTPGGGGFADDFDRLWDVARGVHERLEPHGYHHIFVAGPRSCARIESADGTMTVVRTEPEMATLLSMATAVISAGGYNTVSEIRLAKRPAFFLPGVRKYDDQGERVMDLVRAGLAWRPRHSSTKEIAREIADRLLDVEAMAGVSDAYWWDDYRIGNQTAAEAIFSCSTS